MTMSHLLRRTKKCCLKLFRKLSLNNGPTTSATTAATTTNNNNNNRITNTRTTKYIKHKSRTPKRRKIAPSPENTTNKKRWYLKEETSTTSFEDDSEECSNNNNNNNNININNNNNRRFSANGLNNNLKNYFRIQKNNQILHRSLSETREKNKLNNDFYPKKSILDDEEIIFTENKIYMGFNEEIFMPIKQNYHQHHHHHHHQYNQQQTEFTQFKDNFCKFDDNLNFTTNLLEHNKCCSKIQFEQKLNDKKQDTTTTGTNQNNNYEEIIFEKVIYDKNKKYLNHSPSISSAGKLSTISILDNDNHLVNLSRDLSINFDNLSDKFGLQQQQQQHQKYKHQQEQQSTSTSSHERPLSYYDNISSSYEPWSENNVVIEHTGHFDNWLYSPSKSKCDSLLCNQSYNSDPWSSLNTSRCSTICKCNNPWDIIEHNNDTTFINNNNNNNNNSSLSNSFEKITFDLDKDKCLWDNNNGQHKVSSSTLETWIDDELFDNSFNEELEKRCAIFER